MTNIPIHQSRQERYGKTEKKTITLTGEALDAIQRYADEHNLYFSVAIESLALMGLGQTTAETLPRLITNMLERMMQRYFKRFTKLWARAAISAEEVNYKSDVLLLQTLWREARLAPDTFVEKMQVSMDPQDQPDALARQIRDDICNDARLEAVAHLKRKKLLGETISVWLDEEADDAG